MSYDLSDALSERHASEQLEPPPYYGRRKSVQALLRVWLPVAVLIVLVIGAAVYFVGFKWWYVFPALVAVYMFYRDFYRWRHNHITCSPDDGVLHIQDKAHPVILFFINGSTDDQLPLDDVKLDTPTRTFMDRWVFHCDTLMVGKNKIRDVKDAKHLQAIQKYRESLKKHSVVLDKQQVDINFAILQTLEEMGRDIRDLLTLARQGRPTPRVLVPDPDPDVTEPIEPVSPETDGDDPHKV